MQSAFENFKEIAVICESCLSLKGSSIINCVYTYYKSGYKQIGEQILSQIFEPFQSFLLKWLNSGELDDPMSEFFIICNSEISNLQSFWTDKYEINHDKLPTFINQKMSESILEIGKSRILLQNLSNNIFSDQIEIE